VSGIIFEHYMWDPDAFADVILQVVDYYRNKREAILDYRYRAWLQAKKLSIHRVYPRLLKHFAVGVPDELNDGVLVYDISKLPEVPPPTPPPAPAVTPKTIAVVASTAETVTAQDVEVDIDRDELAEEILSSAGGGKPTKPLRYPTTTWR